MQNKLRIAVDTGGTFTDLCVLDETTGGFSVAKVPSTPDNPALAVMDGVKMVLNDLQIEPEAVAFFIHGTTVATNALLEGKGAPIALITTKGFEDVILIGRQNRPKLYDHWGRRPTPLVARSQCHGIKERTLYTGEILTSLDQIQAAGLVEKIKAAGINSIAVSLLHAYANPNHELQVKEIISRIHPGAHVTISSEVLSEFREYERTSTICINAYVMPRVNNYVSYLESCLKESDIGSDLYIMQSNGGVITSETARTVSARTVLSGPAGGALTGELLARTTENKNVITLDVGGTSSDICLIEKGKARLTTESDIEGYPIKLPMIDINTIGAGGGSIAWIDAGGALQVGPVSAGSVPGPVCYGRGGTEPTVTDANAILGRINPEYLLGGEMRVHLDDTRKVIQEKIADPLGLDLLQTAEGIIRVVNANMVRGMRRVSVERGYDPRDFALVPFGGAGPLHGADLAEALSMDRLIITAHPGIGSAFGMLSADVRHDYVKTHITLATEADHKQVEGLFAEMEAQATDQLNREGFGRDAVILDRKVDMRYLRQAYELTVPLTEALFSPEVVPQLVGRFHDMHRRTYGYARDEEPVEIVNLRLVALGELPGLKLQIRESGDDAQPNPFANRTVYFGGRPLETAIYQRDTLKPGQVVPGPAIVEQLDSTVVVTPPFAAECDPYGNLILNRKEGVQ
ncbi:MAG: hydantoinase/oxoprolinase family protein [bacterium]|nr:hydantoinase/oxoprolinase family protein [bacterium]